MLPGGAGDRAGEPEERVLDALLAAGAEGDETGDRAADLRDGDADENEAEWGDAAAALRECEDEREADEAAGKGGEGEGAAAPKLEPTQEDDEHGTNGGAGRDTQDVGLGDGVTHHGLHCDSH